MKLLLAGLTAASLLTAAPIVSAQAYGQWDNGRYHGYDPGHGDGDRRDWDRRDGDRRDWDRERRRDDGYYRVHPHPYYRPHTYYRGGYHGRLHERVCTWRSHRRVCWWR